MTKQPTEQTNKQTVFKTVKKLLLLLLFFTLKWVWHVKVLVLKEKNFLID